MGEKFFGEMKDAFFSRFAVSRRLFSEGGSKCPGSQYSIQLRAVPYPARDVCT